MKCNRQISWLKGSCRDRIISILLLTLSSISLCIASDTDIESIQCSVAEEIRFEATLPNVNSLGKPLPLMAHWNTGELKDGYSPSYQMRLIEAGHYILPWFQLPSPGKNFDINYYERTIKKAAALKLPISFVSTQWERLLTDLPEYLDLPGKLNPNVIDVNGKIIPKVSPFGPLGPWAEVGGIWTSSPAMRQLQKWYPDPPLVLLLSNNEHTRLQWTEANKSARFLGAYGISLDENTIRKIIGDGWIQRYRVLQQGMRDGLVEKKWKDNSLFVGYAAFGPAFIGRWSRWKDYSLYTPRRIDPFPFSWDGASLPFYVNNWNASTDYTVFSPQIESMNWLFMMGEAYGENPEFWIEMSVWDGHVPGSKDDMRQFYSMRNQTYSPVRYAGMAKYGMWLLRPRVVREFRGRGEKVELNEAYFLSLLSSVDSIHRDPVLRKFWRKGELVPNRDFKHPYQQNIPGEYADAERFFLLNTSANPKRPWKLKTKIRVYSLALVLGDKPNREWLVYVFSPVSDEANVGISIPDYGKVTLDAVPGGAYYHVFERNGETRRLMPGAYSFVSKGCS